MLEKVSVRLLVLETPAYLCRRMFFISETLSSILVILYSTVKASGVGDLSVYWDLDNSAEVRAAFIRLVVAS